MVVKDVISEVLWLVGRYDASYDIGRGDLSNDEYKRLARACLAYLNAVIDELARGHFPLECEETMSSENGAFAFADFKHKPLRIMGVTVNSQPVDWHVVPDYLMANGQNVKVRYTYVPDALGLNDVWEYPDYAVRERLIIYGMLAEYYLVAGDATSYEAWENKYRVEIENILSHSKVRGRIPPRRWI